jgi:hypothetical protein
VGIFIDESSLNIDQILYGAPMESREEVDRWKSKYEYNQSLYNPRKLSELGTQMRTLNDWYLQQCGMNAIEYIDVKVRNHHYFRGNDIIWVHFDELHQLCHMDSLDKSLISYYCL